MKDWMEVKGRGLELEQLVNGRNTISYRAGNVTSRNGISKFDQ